MKKIPVPEFRSRFFSRKLFSILFIIVVGLATVLRFYQYSNIPFTHDEYSAINRLQFNSVDSLIENGIKVDGHPAGVQLFLYYYTSIFETISPSMVRLPFTILGILSVVLIVLIGKKLFSIEAGLLAGSVAAVSQYFIFYSVVARPYSPGLFFTLFSIWILLKIADDEEKSLFWFFLYALNLTLAALMQHFAAFTAFLIYLLGFGVIRQTSRKKYLLSGALSVILYLPHLSITIAQLNMKGVGAWLPVPDWSFLWEHLRYPFHYSWWFFIVFILSVVSSLFFYFSRRLQFRWFFLFLVWFITYFTAFFYSRNVSSVMQNSVLLFSYAGLLIFFSAGITIFSVSWVRWGIILYTLVAGTFTLIFERRHFDVLTHGLFKSAISEYCDLTRSPSVQPSLFVSNSWRIPPMLGIDSCAARNLFVENFNLDQLNTELRSNNFESVGVMIDGTLPGALAMIHEFYPVHQVNRKYDRGEFHFFLHNGTSQVSEWDTLMVKDYDISTNNEFFDLAQWNLEDLGVHSWSEMDIVPKFAVADTSKPVRLVTELHYKNKCIDWREKYLSSKQFDPQGLPTIYQSLVFMDIHYPTQKLFLKIYLWNPQGVTFTIKSSKILLRKANRIRYALYGEIPIE
ncbi:MAG TPA: glycosyltransferase family 39 protein [Salinivirgaceae bacterium]|nr:glycosyltransferase family 39 protein [Salinivirgaceae bacterium]